MKLLSLLLSAIIVPACAQYPSTAPTPLPTPERVPTTIRLSATNGIGASAGQVFVVATIMDANGRGMSASVQFTTTAGTLTPETVVADGGGVAQTKVTSSGPATITAATASVTSQIDVTPNPTVR